jgi:hypothetical protein
MYEHKSEPLLPRRAFIKRLLRHLLFAVSVLASSLGIGILGYHYFEKMSFVDAMLNASMILGGMGPVAALTTRGGKIFASLYALFSGVIFLVVVGIIIAPLAHRLLHRLHLEESAND